MKLSKKLSKIEGWSPLLKSCTAPLPTLSLMFAGHSEHAEWKQLLFHVYNFKWLNCKIITPFLNAVTLFLHFTQTHTPWALNNKYHFLIGWTTFNTINTQCATPSCTIPSSSSLCSPSLSFFRISLINSLGASASRSEIKVAVTHTANGGQFRSISLQYIIPLWMTKECILGVEMTLLRGKFSRGRYIRPCSQGIGLQDGGVTHGSGLGCPANQSTPRKTITLIFLRKFYLQSPMCLRHISLFYAEIYGTKTPTHSMKNCPIMNKFWLQTVSLYDAVV